MHCQVEHVSGNLPEFWGWLADATFNGTPTVHELLYDQWINNVRIPLSLHLVACVYTVATDFVLQLVHCHTYIHTLVTLCLQVAGVELVVLVPQDNPNVPKFLRRRSGPTIIEMEFMMFAATEPAQSDFSVPEECAS